MRAGAARLRCARGAGTPRARSPPHPMPKARAVTMPKEELVVMTASSALSWALASIASLLVNKGDLGSLQKEREARAGGGGREREGHKAGQCHMDAMHQAVWGAGWPAGRGVQRIVPACTQACLRCWLAGRQERAEESACMRARGCAHAATALTRRRRRRQCRQTRRGSCPCVDVGGAAGLMQGEGPAV